ncbi:MAG: tetratricopeptide repeat protein [Marinomonas sp.]
MGLLNWIFGSRKPSTAKNEATFEGSIMTASHIGFMGLYKTSPNRKWSIGWSDSTSNSSGYRGGHRTSGKGQYVLCFENQVVLHGELERPNSPTVANNGSFSIEDWRFGNDLAGNFHIFDSSGKELIKRVFKANILNSSISENGLMAVCQTANSPQGNDGNKLTGFDVENREELFSVTPETGWAKDYFLEESTKNFGVVLNDVGTFYYSAEGVLKNPQDLSTARLNSCNSHTSIAEAENILKEEQPDSTRLKLALEKCKIALKDPDFTNHPRSKARGLKIQGLIHVQLGNDKDALNSFLKALEIDPKIGVKQKTNALKKKLA